MNPEEARSNFEDRLERYSFASSVLFVTANLALDGTVAVFGGIRFRAEPPCVLLIVVAFGLTWLIAVFYLLYNFIKGLKVVENRITTLEEDRPHRSIGVELVILECMSLARSLWHGGSECWSETRAILQVCCLIGQTHVLHHLQIRKLHIQKQSSFADRLRQSIREHSHRRRPD